MLKQNDLFEPLRRQKALRTVDELKAIVATRSGVSSGNELLGVIRKLGFVLIPVGLLSALLIYNGKDPRPQISDLRAAGNLPSQATPDLNQAATMTSAVTADLIAPPKLTCASASVRASLATPTAQSELDPKEAVALAQRSTKPLLTTETKNQSVAASSKEAPADHQMADERPTFAQGEGIAPLNRTPDVWTVGASLQTGIVMGSLNTAGAGFSITASHNWQEASFRYTSTFGTHTSDLIRTLAPGESGWQTVQDLALMAGARLTQGKFWASLLAGPNITKAEFGNVLTINGRSDTTNWRSLNGLGATAQATFGYRVTDELGFSVTGYATNHTVTYGGILFSIVFGKLD